METIEKKLDNMRRSVDELETVFEDMRRDNRYTNRFIIAVTAIGFTAMFFGIALL